MQTTSPEFKSSSPNSKASSAKAAVHVAAVEFSSRTYSVQVVDNKRIFWPILEFDESGRLQDALCECQLSMCEHVRCALEAVTQSGWRLHQRFERQLWHQLLYLLSGETQGEVEDFEVLSSGVVYPHEENESSESRIQILGHTPAMVSSLLKTVQDRPEYNERNSIKFSNLSSQELKSWTRGYPGPWLRYELSPWSDLAKLLFAQDDKPKSSRQLEWSLVEGALQARLQTAEYEVHLKLGENDWQQILPYIMGWLPSAVQSMRWQDHLKGIEASGKKFRLVYDSQVEDASGKQPAAKQQVAKRQVAISKLAVSEPLAWQNEEWVYLPQQGMHRLSPLPLVWPESVSAEGLCELLEELGESHALSDSLKVNFDPVELRYEIDFDSAGALRLDPYVWEKGDLAKGDVLLFIGWTYEATRGFQRLGASPWQTAQVIKPSQVEAFVDEHMEWLRLRSNFEIHSSGLELQLVCQIKAGQSLEWLDKWAERPGLRTYGRWLFTPENGLFWHRQPLPGLEPGVVIEWSDLPSYLDRHREQLDEIHHFWADQSPLQGQYLRVNHHAGGLILEPYDVLIQSATEKKVYWAGNYTYIELEGFFYNAPEKLLPEAFRQRAIISGDEIDEFFEESWSFLQTFVEKLPPELTPIQEARLVIDRVLPKERMGGDLRLEARLVSRIGSMALDKETLRSKKRWWLSQAGLIDRQSPLGMWLQQQRFDSTGSIVEMEALALLRTRLLMPVQSQDNQVNGLLGEWLEASPGLGPDMQLLKAELRPYQEIGVRWMWQLMEYGLGALLCDDMGLGKTHQVMGVMASLAATRKRLRVLVACPTSVLYHWHDKLTTFLPSLSVQIYHGSSRQLDTECSVVLTSYGILRQDRQLSSSQWDLAIFDEVQLAKNARSGIWKSCGAIVASHKIGLSGTPVENSLRDLKALFDLIFPGYLPSDAQFKTQFVHPIEKFKDAQALTLLRQSIDPLVLRRSKREVLTQLPEKMEEVGLCQMSLEQHQLYQSVLKQSREELLERLQDASQSVPYMHIFAVLNALKQICNHPACYWRNREVDAKLSSHESGKWELFTTLLQEALSSNQKVVVFSQYLSMLDLIEEYLHAHHIHYSGLRGSTKSRGTAIRRFQEDPECRVFVASLNAGGLGIELTSGSVVILYDRWWNAARENQAVDRVHRLGQTRGVQVFRLLTQSSIEERIDEIIQRKAKLMDEVTPVDDPAVLKRFTREELIDLLQLPQEGREGESSIENLFKD